MRADRVVFDSPVFDNHAPVHGRQKEFSIETFVPQLIVETFDVSVLPRSSGLDVLRSHTSGFKPLLHTLCDEFGTVVAADKFRRAMLGEEPL